MKIKFTLMLAGLCFFLSKTEAQTANDHFALHDSSPDSILVSDVRASSLTADGGWIVLTGNEYRGTISATTYGFSLVRFDANGNKLWNTFIYGDPGNQNTYRRIIEMTDGGFVIVSNTYFGGSGSLVKTDASGNFLFIKNFSIGILDVQVDSSDDGLLITTNSGNTFSGIIKTDASGNIVWSDTKEFVPDPDHYYTAKRLANGNYLTVGVAYSNPSITMGAGLVACYNSSGTLLWSKTYSVSGQWITEFANFSELSDGNILVGGATSTLNVNGRWPLLTKMDQNGNVLWSKSYGSGMNDFQTTYCFNSDFTYIAGCLWSGSNNLPIVAKLDSSGNMLWSRIYPPTNVNNISFGPFINFGSGTYSSVGEPTVLGNHFLMYNYSDFCSSDTSLSQSCYLSDTSFVRTTVVMTSNVITPTATTPVPTPVADTRTNSSLVNFSKYDVCVPAGIESVAMNQVVSVSVYPNPFSQSARIQINSAVPLQNAELKLFDLLGNEIQTKPVDSNEVVLTREGLPAGVYFCQLWNNGVLIANNKIVIAE